MKIAFYAPLKPLNSRVPSGDLRLAQALYGALARPGCTVFPVCGVRSLDLEGNSRRQQRIKTVGERMALRLVKRWRRLDVRERPNAWFTYHLYYKAPDWMGPLVSSALDIPYLVAEPSYAPKRAQGPWAINHQGVRRALEGADAALALTKRDAVCLNWVVPKGHLHEMAPFLTDLRPYQNAAESRSGHRRKLAARLGLDLGRPWLLAVGMMRPEDKLASYRQLARAMGHLADRELHILIAGDGEARQDVERAFADCQSGRIVFLGEVSNEELPSFYAAADLFVWPAVNEAFGMALLESQAAGTPVVAGGYGGVPEVVAHGKTGLVISPGNEVLFAAAVRRLLDSPLELERMGQAAREEVAKRHGPESASKFLAEVIEKVVARRAD